MTAGSIHPAEQIRTFFARIAPRYDAANHLLSGGLDYWWRWRTARIVSKSSPKRILDLATGSGDLAIALRDACPHSLIIGADFCLPMLIASKAKNAPPVLAADALQLPFAENTFDAVAVAFGLRNMASYASALREIVRILNPGGKLYVLDFSTPSGAFGAVYRFYLHRLLPILARLITRERAAYDYLGDSIENFPQGAEMLGLMGGSGLEDCTAAQMTGGIVTLYTGTKH